MTPAATSLPEVSEGQAHDETRWRTAGERIESLLDASAAGGASARARAEQLVREVTDLYGAGLERMIAAAAAAAPELADAFAADDLVASLLLVHGLHPHPVHRRICDALDRVRPYLGSHGGDVELLDVDLDGGGGGGVARLRFSGNCKSCPSSAVTLELAIEDAVLAAAPEISSLEVVTVDPDPASTAAVIPAESLLARVHANGHRHVEWHPVPGLCELTSGQTGGFLVGHTTVVACRIGDEYFAYRDRCGSCGGTFAGAALQDAVLRCPHCDTGFDVVHAGVAGPVQLEPVPVLVRDGVPALAMRPDEVGS